MLIIPFRCPGEIIPRFSEKTKTGRTYGILRKELDGVLIQENKKKQTAVKVDIFLQAFKTLTKVTHLIFLPRLWRT